MVLVTNIGLNTSISNTTQIRPQYFRNFMCVHWECTWCYCEILVLTLAYLTLHRYAHNISETSCVSTRNVRGASTKDWSNHQHIQPYTNTLTAIQNLHVYPLTMCVVLVPNIGLRTTISNSTQIRPQLFRNLLCPLEMYVVVVSDIYISTSISNTTQIRPQHFRNFMCPLGMCVVLDPNIGLRTTISNTTQICPQHYRNLMCFHWECAWC